MTRELACPNCPHRLEVSEEDADATLSDMLEHLTVRHTGYDRHAAMRMLADVNEITTTVTAFVVAAAPDHANTYRRYDITVELTHGFNGARWAIRHDGRCLHFSGRWDLEPAPSSRTDAWLDNHRFANLDTALRLAAEAAPNITINGVRARDAH